MKGLVFVLDYEGTVKEHYLYHPVEKEMLQMLQEEIVCFELIENDPEEFAESLRTFADRYHLPRIELGSIEGERKKYGLLHKDHLEALKQTLDQKAVERIKKIKKELAKSQPDFRAIAWAAWEKSDDYFVLPGSIFVPEMGLIEYVVNALLEPFPVYISQTFTFEV